MNASAQTESAKHIAYIGLGSNIEPESNLPKALAALSEQVKILKISSAWHVAALGAAGPDFLNAVIRLETGYSADQLKAQVLRPIEVKLGRIRSGNKNAPRTMDLDILIFDDKIIDPHIWDYAHLAVPLAECSPGFTHPVTGQSIAQVAHELQKSNNIRRTTLKFPNSHLNQ
ncbi:MAG: 2-amino-4-hydroxy-6-hydroxymethyldihydropteridine diphosphokinase [Chloroflexi bacterium]|nr:2-amino-4-hydroxy-6-hydroxymethyldihydropteridine diphosphokinase [Chloroflexota bacterium]